MAGTFKSGNTVNSPYDPQQSIYSGDGYLVVLVVDEQGNPVATRNVWLEQGDLIIGPHFNTDDGKSFAGEPGSYMLHVEYPGFQPLRQVVTMKSKLDASQNMRKPMVAELQRLKTEH